MEKKKKTVKAISDRYMEYGQLIDTRANKEVKVIVSGDSFAHLRCSLLLDNARRIDRHQFVTTATQLENEARAVVAKKLKVKTSGSLYKLSSSLSGETDLPAVHPHCSYARSLSMQDKSFLPFLL